MQRRQPTKEDMIVALQRIAATSPDGCVSQRLFTSDTGWNLNWFDRHWPLNGYQGACEEAGVKRGAILGVEVNIRVCDDELATRFADAVERLGKIPPLRRFAILAETGMHTITRGGNYRDAKNPPDKCLFRPADRATQK